MNLFFATAVLGVAAMAQAQTQTASGAAPAQSPAPGTAITPAPPPTRLGVLNFQAAVTNTDEGKQAFTALQSRFLPKKSEFDKRQNEIAGLQDQLKKGSATMSEESKTKLERDLDTKTKAYQRDTQDANDDMEQEGNKIYQELGNKMIKIVNNYATQNGLAAVIDTSNQQSPVLFIAPSLDMTADMIKLYNQAYPVTAAKPAGSAPGAAKPSIPAPGAVKPPAAKPPAGTPVKK